MSFSERYGYKPVKETIQIETMDEPLRNGLWSLLKLHCWDHVHYSTGLHSGRYLSDSGNEIIRILCNLLWFDFFKEPLDQLSNDWDHVLGQLRTWFFRFQWNEVYDFIEFIGNNYKGYHFKDNFMQSCNHLLEKEMSAYRFVNGLITRITDEQEVAEIEQALEAS